jgi:hypothetical protein
VSKRGRSDENESKNAEQNVEISKGELEVLRTIQKQWEEAEPAMRAQPELLASLKVSLSSEKAVYDIDSSHTLRKRRIWQ